MKKIFRLLPFALLGLTLAACNDDDDNTPAPAPEPEFRVLTFEDADYKGTDNGGKGFADWSSLIDMQYGGELLYPTTKDWLYNWNDEENTFLASELTNNYGDYQFWGGGHAVSNYVDADPAHGDFSHQLAIPVAGGHNGSKNFCVHNGHVEAGDTFSVLPSIYFKDGIERIVDHMWVMNTTYTLNIMKNGDAFGSTPFGAEDYLKIIAIGFDLQGKETGRSTFDLANGTDFVIEWTKWDLSSLGEVAKIAFNIEGSQVGEYGLNTPAYFAYDDVAVQF